MELINETLDQVLAHNVKNFPDREAVVYVDDKIRLTWKKINTLSDQIAKGFLAMEIQRGDHIAIWGTNKLPWLLTQIAAAKIGAPLVTINPEWKGQELEYALKQSDTKLLVMFPGFEKTTQGKKYVYDYIKILKEVCPELPSQNPEKLNLEKFPFLKKMLFNSFTNLDFHNFIY